MTIRLLMSALRGALLTVFQMGRGASAASDSVSAVSQLGGREVFDADGVTLGVVEQTVSGHHGERSARYAMVRVSRSGNAGLRLAVPACPLRAVDDGLMLTSDAEDDDAAVGADGEFLPAVSQLSRTI
jgi:hypothetical protein